MSRIFEQYKAWRAQIDADPAASEDEDSDYGDKKAFMRFAKLKKLDNDDFEELELQYDDYLIEQETTD